MHATLPHGPRPSPHSARPRAPRVLLLALVALGAVLVRAAPARAEAERVVLAGVPDNLAEATRTVLVPWHIEIVRTDQPLAPDPDRARRDARHVAGRTRAGAVVWLAPSTTGYALWVYDTSSKQAHARPLASAPPFDEPTAASVALSIKTMLRMSSVAPPAERLPPPRPRPGPPLRPFAVLARASLRKSLPAPDPDERGVEPRLGLGATWWPAFLSGVGASLELELGPGLSVFKSGLRGELADVTARVAAHWRVAWLDGRVALVPGLGLGLHITRLTGELQSDRGSADLTYVLPAAEAGIDVRWRLGRVFEIGAGLGASLMLRTHDFEVDMRPVSTSPALMMTSGITVSASL